MKYQLFLRLKSDTTFGRGDGVAGLVDAEVEHDPDAGLPFLRGRTLKGLLVEECANIFYALDKRGEQFNEAGQFLFGSAGSSLADDAWMHIGPAQLPSELRAAIIADVKGNKLTPTKVLESLTAIRRQSAIDEHSGAPEEGSLRAMRVVLRETLFISDLEFEQEPDEKAKALLAACVLGLRRAGTGRNRGRGRLEAHLKDENGADCTEKWFASFQKLVNGVPV